MFIFYDFETSSREILGQILSYSFIVVAENLSIIEELNGKIALNRLQLPEVEAILTNKINLDNHQLDSDPEYEAARKIYAFLNKQVTTFPWCVLVGYNSNSFDLQFLRNLLIRYGINPYFDGKLGNLDVLHFVKQLAFENEDSFPWVTRTNDQGYQYFSFKLEDMSQKFNLLTGEQSHDAREDVLLTISLVKKLQASYKQELKNFQAFQPIFTRSTYHELEIAKQKITDYPTEDRAPEKYTYRYLIKLFAGKSDVIVLDLYKYSENPDDPLAAIRYINANKQFFISEHLTEEELQEFKFIIDSVAENSFFKTLTRDKYFELIKKDWDIEYQIHEMGFKHIPTLYSKVKELLANPDSYTAIIKELLKSRKNQKDNYLIQLFNRVYLNFNPQAKIEHLHRYLVPRYITGAMLRDKSEFETLENKVAKIIKYETSADLPESDRQLVTAVKNYYADFFKKNQLPVEALNYL